MSKATREFTDPSVYDEYHREFRAEGQPQDQAAWVKRATRVAEILAVDAGAREAANKAPRAEISLLKSAGLLKVLGPTKYGGGGEAWDTGYKVIRAVAAGDGSLGMLLGYHLLWSTTANVVGTPEQADSAQQAIIENNYFVGGAVNPRDNDLTITSQGDEIVFNGRKSFSTGGVISDLTVLEGVLSGSEDHIFTFVKTEQPGLIFAHDWDNVGLRLTESGGVAINNIRVPWTDALGWDASTHKPNPSILGITFSTLLLPTIQLVFSNFYLGIAQGALGAAAKYTAKNTRPWPYGGDNKDRATDEWYILERYGTWASHLDAADALADRAGEAVKNLYAGAGQHGSTVIESSNGHSNGHTNGHAAAGGRESVTPATRAVLATQVARAKVVTTDTALQVTAAIYEVLGARATGKKYAFDRFWRDVRTHTLHDPVAYKKRETGLWALLGEGPEPTWYT
ncbi:Hypothetical protein R9X50_00402500 [Acrodontium crateriforme]|uniref:Uncharacterized protein n=1 Tax=Acrodontium crateriforme TaxID=150365 RepID=A0AAQ3M415_9PEZI|nr:Hypothetical protein R9X50_00402500 [Acrodontium crateriforme]